MTPITYERFVNEWEKRIRDQIDEIDGIPHFFTTMFPATRYPNYTDERQKDLTAASSVLKSLDHCYGCFMHGKHLLGNNYSRKADLKPYTIAFADFPGTKFKKSKGGLPQYKWTPAGRFSRVGPHIHAILVAHPYTKERLDTLGSDGLHGLFKRFCSDVMTVHLKPIEKNLRRVLKYSSKALTRYRDEAWQRGLWTGLPDSDWRPPTRTERLLRVGN